MNDQSALAPSSASKANLPGSYADLGLERAYQFCLLHAAVDDAFSPVLTRGWFMQAFALCASFSGLVWPPRKVKETTSMGPRGIPLSLKPSGMVSFYRGVDLLARLPPDHPCLIGGSSIPYCDPENFDLFPPPRTCCPPELCDCCGPITAIYMAGPLESCDIGKDGRPSPELPAMFVQAVARVFTFMAENRGDTQLDELTLSKCNAKTFLNGDMLFVL